jgi:hypothetical protein
MKTAFLLSLVLSCVSSSAFAADCGLAHQRNQSLAVTRQYVKAAMADAEGATLGTWYADLDQQGSNYVVVHTQNPGSAVLVHVQLDSDCHVIDAATTQNDPLLRNLLSYEQ